MTESAAKLVDALAHLVSACIWPAVFLWLALRFSPSLKIFFDRITELSFEVAGVKGAAKANVATALNAATLTKEHPIRSSLLASVDPNAISAIADQFASQKYIKRVRESRILWVDDRPEHNIFERMAFEAVGIRITLARGTEEALNLSRLNSFNAIISDMSRPPDAEAGYTLLAQLGTKHPPFIIYSGSDNPAHDEQAKAKGALGSTSSSTFLFASVMKAIAGNAS